MERAHYRRVAQPGSHGRDAQRSQPAESGASQERLIIQGIVSGLILAAVLTIRLIDNDMTARIRNNLFQALSGQVSVENIVAGFQKLDLSWPSRPLPELPEEVAQPDYTEETVGTMLQEPETVLPVADTSSEIYIDEDVLAELNARSAYENVSKSPVPEPIASPEP